LVEPAEGEIDNQNVFGVDRKGTVIWQVQARKYRLSDSPFSGIGTEGGLARLYNWDGTVLCVDPLTGEVLETDYAK